MNTFKGKTGICDICGKPRGFRSVSHDRCSKIRQQRRKLADAGKLVSH